MRLVFSIVLLVAAAVLLTFGVQASDSVASEVSRVFNGTPTDRSIWLIVAGAVCGLLGLMGLAQKPRLAN